METGFGDASLAGHMLTGRPEQRRPQQGYRYRTSAGGRPHLNRFQTSLLSSLILVLQLFTNTSFRKPRCMQSARHFYKHGIELYICRNRHPPSGTVTDSEKNYENVGRRGPPGRGSVRRLMFCFPSVEPNMTGFPYVNYHGNSAFPLSWFTHIC